MQLTRHPLVTAGDGPKLKSDDVVVQYVVGNLPHSEEAWLCEKDGKWRILRATNNRQGEWYGDYATADDALEALAEELVGPTSHDSRSDPRPEVSVSASKKKPAKSK